MDCEQAPWLRQTLDAVGFESRCTRPGAPAAMSYLACVLFVRVVRGHVSRLEDAAPGLLRALNDPYIAPVIEAIYNKPAMDWTVEALADVAALPRSAFAERVEYSSAASLGRRFKLEMGQTPGRYRKQVA